MLKGIDLDRGHRAVPLETLVSISLPPWKRTARSPSNWAAPSTARLAGADGPAVGAAEFKNNLGTGKKCLKRPGGSAWVIDGHRVAHFSHRSFGPLH